MIDYDRYDALGLAKLVRSGEVSAAELLDIALDRQTAKNPEINAIIYSLEKEARQAIEAGLPDGPFHGVPFLLKDLNANVPGAPSTNGCRFFQDFIPERESELVARYRRAGLVTFGKTATPEFGLTTTTESEIFGATRNPWSLSHTSGGSSGGASAAVAAGILPAAHASDGGGSIRIPASCCGLFGLKPTRARNPAGPDVGEGWSGMSTAHAITRSVRDSAALLDATAGPDVGAPYWAPPPERPFLEEVGAPTGRLRIAVQTRAFNDVPTASECLTAVEEAVRLCEALGHEVVEADLPIDFSALGDATRVIIFSNLRASLDERARSIGRPWQAGDIETITATLLEINSKATATDYAAAVRTVHAVGRQVERFLEDFDVLLTPTMAAPPQPIGALSLSHPDLGECVGNLMKTTAFTQVFNASGHPAMSVPLSWSATGLPIGVQFAGRMADEASLFRLAAQLEGAQPWWDRRPAA